MTTTRHSVSVVIITLNEEHKIRDCLESVKWADEIVVMDSLSTDRTVEIAREYTSKVFQQEFLGDGPMRNAAIDKAAGEWIFTIDADERVTPELRVELEHTLADPAASAYEIPRKAYFLGKWMKHCEWWPDYVLRLFHKERGRYDDHLAHARVVADGTVERLENPLLHIPYADLDEYIRKINSHTNLMAREKGHRATISKACLRMIARFGQSYILKRGFLDGREGLVMSVLASYYVFVKYMKIWEASRRKP